MDKELKELGERYKEVQNIEIEQENMIKEIQQEIENMMNNKDLMEFAYLTEMDIKQLMNNNKIKTPFVLI